MYWSQRDGDRLRIKKFLGVVWESALIFTDVWLFIVCHIYLCLLTFEDLEGNRRSGTSNEPWWGCVKILLRVLAFPARMLGITMVWDLESRGQPVYLLPEKWLLKWLLCAIPDISGMGCEIFHVGIIANLGYAEESRICSTTQRHAVSWFILFNMDAEKFEHRTLYARLILSNSWAICLFLSCWDDTEYNVCNVYNYSVLEQMYGACSPVCDAWKLIQLPVRRNTAPDPKISGNGIDQTPQRTGDPDTLSQRGYGPTTLSWPPCTAEGWNIQLYPYRTGPQTRKIDCTRPPKNVRG